VIVFGQGGRRCRQSGRARWVKNSLDLAESATAEGNEADLDDRSIPWAGLTAAVEILNAWLRRFRAVNCCFEAWE
jgi:hypothetical protein